MTHERNEPADNQIAPTDPPQKLPVVRTIVAGALMGLANLVPGVSGGTMILIMGLYNRFITSLADVTKLKFSRQSVIFLAIVAVSAGVGIVSLSGVLLSAVSLHESAMFSLFIGMTLGGAPLLMKMIGKPSAPAVIGVLVGIAVMILVAATQTESPDKEKIKEAIRKGELVVEADYTRDVVAGTLGMSAMVLPGISGGYMLLIIGRYPSTLGAITLAKDYAISGGEGDATTFLSVLIPVAAGALIGLVVLASLLKWLLRRYEKPTLGVLLGIVLGSVIGIWPFGAASQADDYVIGTALAITGFVGTTLLARIKA